MRRLLLFLFTVCSWSAPPVIFYTDLASGPKVGGPSNNGTILTICGKNFGSSQGGSTVTIGGGAPATYLRWVANDTVTCGGNGNNRQMDAISVAIGASAATGPVVVTVSGVASNSDKNFTVTTWSSTNNRIFCEDSVSGVDTNNGQCAGDSQVLSGTPGPWKTLRHVKGILNTGDIVYFGKSGVDYQSEFDTDPCGTGTIIMQTSCGGAGAAWAHSGTPSQPIALVGYPGQNATFGCATTSCPPMVFVSTTNAVQSIRYVNLIAVPGQCAVSGTPAPLHCTSTVVSGGANGGFRLGGNGAAPRNGPGDVWLVNNKSTCPNGNQPNTGCDAMTFNSTLNTPGTITLHILGNHLVSYTDYTTDLTVGWGHNQAIYLGFDTNETEVAWNDIDGSGGYSAQGMHIHSSAIGSTGGFPLYGIHIHDNYIHDTPAGNDLSTFDPSTGSGVEFYNNLYIHQGDCLAYPGSAPAFTPGGWIQGFRRNGAHSFGQPQWDENWAPMHGTIQIYNNTYKDLANCASPGTDGWISMVAPSGTSATVKPPPDVTICSGSCSTHQSGTLPPASPTYAADNIGFQVTNGAAYVTSIADDGAGNLLEAGVNVGTINYGTGAYNFTLTEGSLATAAIIKYRTIYGYRVNFRNNIIWQRSSTPSSYLGTTISSPILLNNRLTGDHNLFFTVGGQTAPSQFTSNIGSNSDPLFVTNGTLGAIPSNGDYHIQAGSPAVGAAAVILTARTYDGLLRTAPDNLGALSSASPAGGINMLPAPPATSLGASYSYQATASGTNGACGTWVKSSGSFPGGLSISGAGLISGTVAPPTGTFTFQLQCTDVTPTTFTSNTFSILVVNPTTVTISGQVTMSGSAQVAVH